MRVTEIVLLATALRTRGLRVEQTGADILSVANPVASSLSETVHMIGDCYQTGWSYEFGQTGAESAAADRLAFLLGAPTGSVIA